MKINTKRLVTTALMMALCFIATGILQLYRLPNDGYVHPGDIMVLLCGFLPGGWLGAFAAGAGSSLADLYAGASQYAVVTFLIKAAMALIVWTAASKKKRTSILTIFAFVIASLVMIGGYFAFEAFMYGTEAAGIINMLLGSVPQALTGIVGAYIILFALDKAGFFKRYHI